MESSLFSFINLLEFEGGNALFQQRETGEARTPFEMERQVFEFVAAGDADAMVNYYMQFLLQNPNPKFSVGKLSRDELRQMKYMAVSAIAIVCRVAMSAGAPEAAAYGMSDDAIQQIDKNRLPLGVLYLVLTTVYKFTELVGQSRQNTLYSKPVREGVEYIVAHLHSKITLDELVRGKEHNKEYYAKLFKKEVGSSIGDYILDLRVQEAKKLLLEGKSSREIAYLLQFCSQSYFIQQFKKVAGVTPREYRQLHR